MSNNVFLEDWKNQQYNCLAKMYPTLSKAQIMKVLDDDISEKFKDPETIIHNDYMDDRELKQNLTLVYRFAKERKPILAGNGTLFYNQDKVSSPIADLIDDRIDTRTKYKNQMKATQKEMDNYEKGSKEYNELLERYNTEDMNQMEAKIRINSIYGSFGAPTFQLYNKYTAASTTGTAQSLISCTGISFEAFIGNHVPFKSFGECIVFMQNTITDVYTMPMDGIKVISDKTFLHNYLVDNFEEGVWNDDVMDDLLWDYLDNLTIEEMTKIYYKNNIYEFVKNDIIADIIRNAFSKEDNFNDPNKVPEEIKDDMELLWAYCKDFVFYNHAYNERINRLKNDTRVSVKLIDTDSNLVNTYPWLEFLKDNLNVGDSSPMDDTSLNFACINTLVYLVTQMLKSLLDKYCTDCHVLDRYHHRINMKNEFCFETLLLAPTKKRYVAKIVLREGIPIVKTEIKGHDFKKAGVTEYLSEKLINVVETRILNSNGVDIPGMLRDLDDIEKEIYSSLAEGRRDYLVRMNCKVPEAYKRPESMGQVTSVLAWNTICPNAEIMVPDKLDVVLVKIPNEAALEPIKDKFPVEYDRINRLLLHGPVEGFRKNGVKYIAIPNSLDKIPDWIIPLIDYNYIVSRNLGTFKPILESLGLPPIGSKSISYFSNIRYNTTLTI